MTSLYPTEPDLKIGEDGFDGNDLLNRKPVGKRLTEIVDRIDQPLVIALDGHWGTGKSFFLKMWTGAHKKKFRGQAKIIYFDAFEHDCLGDPLVSLVAAVTRATEDDGAKAEPIAKLKNAAMLLAVPVLRTGLAVATAGASETVGAVWAAGVNAIGDEAAKAAEEFWRRESGRVEAMRQFRAALQSLTKPAETDGPRNKIVFIVDELDRCRPDYALAVLEIVKHFFAAPGVHFVLGVNFEALAASVTSRYGAGIDADGYLRKFIHLSVRFPEDNEKGTVERYLEGVKCRFEIGQNTGRAILEIESLIRPIRAASIRDIERVLARISLLPDDFEKYHAPERYMVIIAIFLEVTNLVLYNRLINKGAYSEDVFKWFGLKKPLKLGRSIDNLLWSLIDFYASPQPDPESEEFLSRFKESFPFGDIHATLERLLADCLDTFSVRD